MAFDSINRNMLFSRLIECGISSKMIHIIIALYTNVMSCVKLNNSITDIFHVKTDYARVTAYHQFYFDCISMIY